MGKRVPGVIAAEAEDVAIFDELPIASSAHVPRERGRRLLTAIGLLP